MNYKCLIFLIFFFIMGCSNISVEPIPCPTPPKAGPEVAKELRIICKDENNCRNLIDFFQRYEKHYDILQMRLQDGK